jgi:hypothetical protein
MNQKQDLYALIHHLKEYPLEFQQLKHDAGNFTVTRALISDLYRAICGDFAVPEGKLPSMKDFEIRYFNENTTRSIYLGVWFFHHPIFLSQPALLDKINTFLLRRLPPLCEHVTHQQWVDDEDRSEEFIREALQCCNMSIDGETPDEATDRLDALSTLKRQRVLKETNESMERMKAIRKKMAEDKAREAANVYGRD